ncbi:ATP-binding protein [Planosporangium mesophilum]|nr:ATP-binding protein [Planosporangium mesophilum]NJC82903.1 response regulator [Planosporangium mesophilum]
MSMPLTRPFAEPNARRRGWPLRRYLIGLVVLFVVAAATGTWYGWVQSRREALRAASADASFGARMAAGETGRAVAAVRRSVTQVAAHPGIAQVYADPSTCALSFELPGGGDTGHLDLLRADGSVVCSSLPPAPATRTGYAGAAWLAHARQEPVLSAPVPDPATGRPAALVTVPVPGLGVMAGFINLHWLGPEMAAYYGGPRGLEFLVTTADGTTALTRSVDPERWAGASLQRTPFGTRVGSGEHPDVTGAIRLYGHADVEGLGWRVYAGADRAGAIAAASRLARQQFLIVVFGLFVALAAAFVVYRRIARPIGRLSLAVQAATVDDRERQVSAAAGGPAEVSALAENFDALAHAVRHELTERRHAEKAAQESQRSYRQLFDNNPYPMWVVDMLTLAFLEVNDAAVAHYGYSRDEFLSMTLADIRLPEDRPAMTESLRAMAATDRGGPVRHVKKDGTVITVVGTSHALTFNGVPARCAVIEDVTEKEQFQRRLRQSERMESLGQLAGGVAHDFNNLLGVIVGYATFAAEEIELAARADAHWQAAHDDLTQVLKAADRASDLTRQLLSFARREVVNPEVIDLNAIVVDIEKMLRRTLGEDIELRTRLRADSPVKVDPGQIGQVLVNLAVNARDAMPAGGILVIDTDNLAIDEHYAAHHPGARLGAYVRLRVSDTGTGMSPDTVERAFEPFFTTKPVGQGTGLGLATLYGIVTQAGGYAQIYSEPGVGTTVTVLLPATSDTTPSGETVTAAPRQGRGETVLVVEDEDNLRALTERILTRNNYHVITAANGAEALAVARQHAGPIDLLLTDVVMPQMLGHDLARELLASHPDLRVVYMSGYAEPLLTIQKTMPSEVSLLSKPIQADVLLNAINRALDPR